MKYEFHVEELDCANCAAKLEDKISQNEKVKSATINFMKGKAVIESDLSEEELIPLLNKTSEDMGEEAHFHSVKEEHHHTHNHEHHHEHHHDHDHEHEHEHHDHDHCEDGSCETEPTEYILRVVGLDCANCAAKLENKLNEAEEIHHASINFMKEKAIVESHLSRTDLIALCDRISKEMGEEARFFPNETGVLKQGNHYTFTVRDLDCANCAAKLENRLNMNDQIHSASINFMKEKAEVESDLKEEDLILLLNQISEELGEEARFIKEEKQAKKKEETKPSWELYRILVSIVLFVGALLLPAENGVRIPLFLLAYVVCGYEVILKAVKNMGKGQLFDENFLMTLATVGAILLREYPEACGVMIFYQIGEYFQDLAVEKSRRSISDLMDIRPDVAHLSVNGEFAEVHPSEVDVDDVIAVYPGEKIPLDGVVIEGEGEIDSRALTGESLLKGVKAGDTVLSGSISSNSLLKIRVTKEFSQSTASKILELVEDATDHKSDHEKFITRFSRVYTPIVVFAALIIAFVVPLLLQGKLSYEYIYRALVFLMVSCPCALVVSIPLSYFGGLGGASKSGVIIKGSNYLETLGKINTLVFDKTGTLTKGEFGVTSIHPVKLSEEELLEKAAYAEAFSTHPIGQSIVRKYGKDIEESRLSEVKEIANRGVSAKVGNDTVLVGSRKLLAEAGVKAEDVSSYEAVIYVAINNEYAGYFTISDELKETTEEALTNLRNHGISNLVMLTGDSKTIADAIGEKLHLSEVYSELLPDEKVKKVEELMQKDGNVVAFAGDGINDAPVLKRSHLGIAMGALGSDAAIEAADGVLMHDDLRSIDVARTISKKTRRIVYENIVFALGVKLIVLVLGALGKASMWAATFADVGVAMLCILNALRLLKKEK